MKFTTVLRIKKKYDHYGIQPTDPGDNILFKKLMDKRRAGDETAIIASFDLPERDRTYDQLKTVWALVGIIFESTEGRKGMAEELYALYLDLLEIYAEKVPNRFNNALRPVHVSREDPACDVSSVAYFIEGLMLHLSQECKLPIDAQTEVRGLLTVWSAWRGRLENDPLDECRDLETWRRRHPYSEASGKSGAIERAHIVSRGADAVDIEEPWNWIALTHDEHIGIQHALGWEELLNRFPHLAGRVGRARNQAHKMGYVEKTK